MSTDAYFMSEGARLRYRDEGTGAVIVLVHGWTLDLEMWNPQAAALKERFRIIRFDRRGFGLSSGAPHVGQDAVDLIALCRHLNTGPVSCVGMSQGARAVLHLAQLEPHFLRSLALDGPPAIPGTPKGPQADFEARSEDLDYASLRTLAQNEGLHAFLREWSRHPLMALETRDPAQHQLLASILARYPGRDLLSTSDASQPVIDCTPAKLRSGEALARALPNCERVLVPHARHMANLDNPPGYNAALLRFFSSQPP
jgi:serine-type D-Ala-D-Ala carboxypeptidase